MKRSSTSRSANWLATIEKTHAQAGSVIVMNPNNGEILALANWPMFNPNVATGAQGEARMNRSVSAVYEPGSTFKLVTLAAAFDQGLIRGDRRFRLRERVDRLVGAPDSRSQAVWIADRSRYSGEIERRGRDQDCADAGTAEILRLHPRIWIWGADRRRSAWREQGIAAPAGNMERDFDRVGVDGAGSGRNANSVDHRGVGDCEWRNDVSAACGAGIAARDESCCRRRDRWRTVEPRRVIRPETAATLRRLMEGVVLNGTGFLARLDGWTAAGKTGSAQKIDPATGRYSPTNFVASFTGFAPINNPAVTILVSIDSPVGLHEGGPVAAPVFKRIAEQVLPYLDVPRDVQLNPRLIQAAYKKQTATDAASLDDFTATDFSGQPDEMPAESNQGVEAPTLAPPQRASQSVTTMDEGGGCGRCRILPERRCAKFPRCACGWDWTRCSLAAILQRIRRRPPDRCEARSEGDGAVRDTAGDEVGEQIAVVGGRRKAVQPSCDKVSRAR